MRNVESGIYLFVCLLLACVCVFAKKPVEPTIVATSIPALECLAKEILKGTPISVVNPFGNEISIDELDGICKEFEMELDTLSSKIAAVIDIRSVIPNDRLFIHIRYRNIKAVEIDCANPSSPVITAIGKIKKDNGEINPFVWLSLSNSIRIAEVLESDLSALFPKYAKTISANLSEFKKNINNIRNDFVRRFLEFDNFNAVCFSDDFDYMLKDIDLFIVEKFPPEYDWDKETAAKFENLLENQQISTVICKWEAGSPAAEIMDKFGIKESVLKTGFPAERGFENGFLEFWKENAAAILNAISK